MISVHDLVNSLVYLQNSLLEWSLSFPIPFFDTESLFVLLLTAPLSYSHYSFSLDHFQINNVSTDPHFKVFWGTQSKHEPH